MNSETVSHSRTRELEPLKITCTSTDCDNGLHCFRQTRKMKTAQIRGVCRECGVSLVDWSRLRIHDLSDVDYTFASLQQELIRHHFWHKQLDQIAENHARHPRPPRDRRRRPDAVAALIACTVLGSQLSFFHIISLLLREHPRCLIR
jgi:hypothetical protein